MFLASRHSVVHKCSYHCETKQRVPLFVIESIGSETACGSSSKSSEFFSPSHSFFLTLKVDKGLRLLARFASHFRQYDHRDLLIQSPLCRNCSRNYRLVSAAALTQT